MCVHSTLLMAMAFLKGRLQGKHGLCFYRFATGRQKYLNKSVQNGRATYDSVGFVHPSAATAGVHAFGA
jgi:hypothetical protein